MQQVGKRDIVCAGHPVLRQRAQEVDPSEIGEKPLRDLVRTMIEAMRRAPGVGLAAPQIGVAKRVIVLEDAERLMASLSAEQRQLRGRAPFPLKVILNPVLSFDQPEQEAVFFEGCLSVPGWSALVPRKLSVTVRGLDEKGDSIEWSVSGWPARILQHEVDHIEGTLYVDRMWPRSFGLNEEVAQHLGKLSVAQVRELLDV